MLCPFTVLAQNAPVLAAPAQGSPTPTADVNRGAAETSTVLVTDGAQHAQIFQTVGRTVAGALEEMKITLSPGDKVAPPLTASVTTGTPITITRVRTEKQTETAAIPYKTVFRMSPGVPAGQIVKGAHGRAGVLTKTFLATYTNDHLTSRKLVSKVVTKPAQDEETLGGVRQMARALPSRGGSYQRLRMISMVATGYSPREGNGRGICATGMRAGYGVVAVDPRVIRLHSRLYIEGYGYAVAGDTGGAIKGRRVDLGHNTYREACNVGRKHVKVWVLDNAR
ncbi:hypothetical protein CCAX7_29430 [Capsulimonas corticalis]|uniref:Uncharacterized protein n=2 Tax=Capsulimonas corticalis TaxID=2219043 RepID=A0A402CT21_9BACT|nr:hypothetical protein CCAX7_29430 [Capsulimonas corticalis]